MSEILGYTAAIAVGLTLGIIGAGGAILTVPILVYLMKVNPVTATVYSLFIVGCTTLIGSVSYMKNGLVNFKTSFAFAVPSLVSIFITRKFIVPSLPGEILHISDLTITKEVFILVLFAIIMLLASFSMVFGNVKERDIDKPVTAKEYLMLFFYGIIVGFVSGMVGAGGGFLIVPALVLLAKIPIKAAIGTSLFIITLNSLSGFIGDLTGDYIIDWKMLLIFLGLAVIGILTGSYLAKFIKGKNLKKFFGIFIFGMGVYIIAREFLSLK